MNNSASAYSLGIRLAHFLGTILLLSLLATGARLAWYGQGLFSQEVSRLVDWLSPTGRVHHLHMLFGVTFVAVGLFYLIYLLLSNQASRLFGLYPDGHYRFHKKLWYLLSLAVGAIAFLTGVTLYCGLYFGSDGYIFIKYTHYFPALFLLAFIFAHLVEVATSRGRNVNAIFFGAPCAGFVHGKALVWSAVISLAFGLLAFALITRTPTLVCRQQNGLVTVDGREHETEWSGADSLVVETAGGINFEDGSATIIVKTFRDAGYIYFLVKWTDPTRSYNQHLLKTKEGWTEEASKYIDLFGESIYSQDKLALSFCRNKGGCAATCHMRAAGRMGLHYTNGDTIDVWQWMAVSTNPARQADDRWWGTYENDSVGGRHGDNIASGGHKSNLNKEWRQPYFLPWHWSIRDWVWYGAGEYTPYRPDLDTFAVGSQLPAVLVAPSTGDRGDVRARGVWRGGAWTVEYARRLSTGSPFDAVFRGNLYLGIAPFDNADSKHAYHLTPIRFVVE